MFKLSLIFGISFFSVFFNDSLEKEIQAAKVNIENADFLVYEMTYLNTIYTYEMELSHDDSLGMVLNWRMKSPNGKSGKITVTNGAYEEANQIQTSFQSGEKVLDKAVCMLLSKKIFSELESKNSSNIYLSPTDFTPVKFLKQENSLTNCKVNGQVEKLFTSTIDGFRSGKPVKLTYWDNAEFPVILSSEQEVQIRLVEIRTK